jgi:soluble lytic murein transglycosylase-like protein
MKAATIFIIAVALGWHFAEPVPPSPLSFAPLSMEQIQKGIAYDQKEKEYTRATIAARLVYRHNGCKATYAEATGRAAIDAGVSARLLAAVVFVESSCNPKAVSGRASVGLCQINPLVWGHSRAELTNPERNLRIGASILSSYTHKYGLVEGLHHYNGLGNPDNTYADKVLSVARMRG